VRQKFTLTSIILTFKIFDYFVLHTEDDSITDRNICDDLLIYTDFVYIY